MYCSPSPDKFCLWSTPYLCGFNISNCNGDHSVRNIPTNCLKLYVVVVDDEYGIFVHDDDDNDVFIENDNDIFP